MKIPLPAEECDDFLQSLWDIAQGNGTHYLVVSPETPDEWLFLCNFMWWLQDSMQTTRVVRPHVNVRQCAINIDFHDFALRNKKGCEACYCDLPWYKMTEPYSTAGVFCTYSDVVSWSKEAAISETAFEEVWM